MELSGTILQGRDFTPIRGTVVVEDGEIAAVEEHATDSDLLVTPAFVNAHTHLGDSIAKEAGEGLSLEELVAPPDGLKHRLLREADREALVSGMRRSLRYMQAGGTGACLDFREGGPGGIAMLREAAAGLAIDPVIFGRDEPGDSDGPDDPDDAAVSEDPPVLEDADGFGASGANDADFAAARAAAREAGKPFGIHAGEVDASDLDPALDLEPDHLVHAVHAEDRHLDRIEDQGVPVVVCPRSNLVTGVGPPPVDALVERTSVALGTDNVFLNAPSTFRELAFTAKTWDLPAADVLAMATWRAAEVAGLEWGAIEADRPAKLLVLDGDSDNLAGVRDPVRAVVRRAGHVDVEQVVL